MKVLITGGAGYIGSHTCLELLKSGHIIHVVDSLSNSHHAALERVIKLSNRELGFSQCDVRDGSALDNVFGMFKPDAVIHCAGLKAVGESVVDPAIYYDVNVGGTAVLLSAMERSNCMNIVFSSSATVYGIPTYLPCDENHPLNPINPYGRTKLMAEDLLRDWSNVTSTRRALALRYFNPVGADISGKIGEDPNGVPSNLMPYISQVAVGRRQHLSIFGDDYDTPDGTGIRDYIHVTDLAVAHVAAVEKVEKLDPFEAINIGRGQGLSVFEILRAFEDTSGRHIPYTIAARRPGDAAEVWADNKKSTKKIGFTAKRGAKEMCEDTWRWQQMNPDGFSFSH